MNSQGIRINEQLGGIVFENGSLNIVENGGRVLASLSAADVDRLTNGHGDVLHRLRPLNESDVSQMIQQLAGDGLLRLASMARGENGYSLRLRMKRWQGVRWTVRNWGDWYIAQEESRLETIKRS